MKPPIQRWQVLGLLEPESDSATVVALADALLGSSAPERFVPLAVASDETTRAPICEPCMGDEMAVRPYHLAQEAIADVGRAHGASLTGRRPLLGAAGKLMSVIPTQVRIHGADLLIAARGSVLTGAALAEVIARSQVPGVVAGSSLQGPIRKLGVAVEPGEGSLPLMEQALVLAASLGVPLVPVFVARPEVEGERRASPAQETKRFEQMMSQLELAFGAAYATRATLQPLEVVQGEVVETLRSWVATAEVDLLVVASGRSGRTLLALGGVAAGLVASCPAAVWVEPFADRA